MDEWLKKEIELATKDSDDYIKACYNSAAKAYMSMAEDGHSGMSASITGQIFNRMLDHKPLTPLTGEEDEWNGEPIDMGDHGKVTYSNKRYSGLFKRVCKNGNVEYSDVHQFIFQNVNNPNDRFCNGRLSDIMREYVPIEFPYMPTTYPIEVFVDEFLVDPKKGDYDTQAIVFYKHGGKIYDVKRYFNEQDGTMKEITLDEFKELSKSRITNKECDQYENPTMDS